MPKYKKDIKKLSLVFSVLLLRLLKQKKVPYTYSHIVSQILRSSSSISANCAESECALTRKEYTHKLSLALKEAKETHHWMTFLIEIFPEEREKITFLNKKLNEIISILYSSVKKLKMKT